MSNPPLPAVAALSRLGYIADVPPPGLAWCMSLLPDPCPAPEITVGQRADGTWVVGLYSAGSTLARAVMVALGEAGMALRVIDRDQPTPDFIAEATAHMDRADALLELLRVAKDLP